MSGYLTIALGLLVLWYEAPDIFCIFLPILLANQMGYVIGAAFPF
jgi:hypothetical protein